MTAIGTYRVVINDRPERDGPQLATIREAVAHALTNGPDVAIHVERWTGEQWYCEGHHTPGTGYDFPGTIHDWSKPR